MSEDHQERWIRRSCYHSRQLLNYWVSFQMFLKLYSCYKLWILLPIYILEVCTYLPCIALLCIEFPHIVQSLWLQIKVNQYWWICWRSCFVVVIHSIWQWNILKPLPCRWLVCATIWVKLALTFCNACSSIRILLHYVTAGTAAIWPPYIAAQ